MKIECLHGYFKFHELEAGQLSKFMSLYDLEIERSGDHFTFSDLVDAPKYSIAGGTFLGSPTLVTFEGEPWDVMRKNGLVYDIVRGLVVPIISVINAMRVEVAGNYFVTSGMIQPGSVTDDGRRVTDYSAFYISTRANFKYSGIEYL